NRTILREQVAWWGMAATSAEDGPRALVELRAAAEAGRPYELALLDMQMPEMDGLELASAIAADPALATTRLVLLTSLGTGGWGADSQALGLAASLPKPVRQVQLFETLAQVMDQPAAPVVRADPPRTGGVARPAPPARTVPRESAAVTAPGGPRLLLAEDSPI